MFSYERLSKKPLLFKSFAGLTVQQFDDINDKEITKRYDKYEIQHLSKIKDNRERETGAVGRPFKLDLEKVSYAFNILSSLHNLCISGLSL